MDPLFPDEPRLIPVNQNETTPSRLTVEPDSRMAQTTRAPSRHDDDAPLISESERDNPPSDDAADDSPGKNSVFNNPLSFAGAVDGRIATLIIATIVMGICLSLLPDSLFQPLESSAEFVATLAGPWLMALATVGFIFLLVISTTPMGSRRIGSPTTPLYGRLNWTLLVLASGLGSGILTWSVAEPMFHMQMNPLINDVDTGARAAAANALAITWLHWGFHYWATVGIMALVFSMVLNKTSRQPSAHLVALLAALLVTALAASVIIATRNVLPAIYTQALEVGLINGGLIDVRGSLTAGPATLTLAVIGCAFAALLLAVAPRLSGLKTAAWVGIVLLVACFGVVAAQTPLLDDPWIITESLQQYGLNVAPALPFGELLSDSDWASLWSGYYASWWWLLCPLPAFFIARISAGRSIRDLILTVVGLGGLITFAWTTLIGGSALITELTTSQFAQSVRLDVGASVPALIDATVSPSLRSFAKFGFILLAILLLLTNLATSIWAVAGHYSNSRASSVFTSGAVAGLVIFLSVLIAERETMARVDLILVSLVPAVAIAFAVAFGRSLVSNTPPLSDRSAPTM